jgi:hypothetical protein
MKVIIEIYVEAGKAPGVKEYLNGEVGPLADLNRIMGGFGEKGRFTFSANGEELKSIKIADVSIEINEAQFMAVRFIEMLDGLKKDIDKGLGSNCTYIVKTAE